jgi:hypothetical protein
MELAKPKNQIRTAKIGKVEDREEETGEEAVGHGMSLFLGGSERGDFGSGREIEKAVVNLEGRLEVGRIGCVWKVKGKYG